MFHLIFKQLEDSSPVLVISDVLCFLVMNFINAFKFLHATVYLANLSYYSLPVDFRSLPAIRWC